VWAQWQEDPTLVDARWDELGVGEVECPDGRLYLSAALRENPTMPASGRYVTPVHPAGQIQALNGLRYGQAVNHQGVVVDLLLDLYLPPSSPVADRPTIVMVRRGGFSGGTRANLAASALEFARRGFVAASIDYRLRPNETVEEQLVAASAAIDDAMESVRWLKSQAATYGIDADRIALLGTSAGGAIALGVAVAAPRHLGPCLPDLRGHPCGRQRLRRDPPARRGPHRLPGTRRPLVPPRDRALPLAPPRPGRLTRPADPRVREAAGVVAYGTSRENPSRWS
jgi:hypothetical protein